MTAAHLIGLLASRHSGDVFVPECKNGPTQGVDSYRRMDAWVLRKSWSNFGTIGYEVKVSRSDFLNDTKWTDYLPYCHEFYFVAPKGLIGKNELPKEAGLIEAFANGNGLRVVKKSPRRSEPIDELVLYYVLMCRTRIVSENGQPTREERIEAWAKTLDRAKSIGSELSRLVCAETRRIHDENVRLRNEAAKIEEVKRQLTERGFNLDRWGWEYHLADEIVAASGDIRNSLAPHIKQLEDALARIKPMLATTEAQ